MYNLRMKPEKRYFQPNVQAVRSLNSLLESLLEEVAVTTPQSQPFFLFLGDCDRDGPASKLRAAGIDYWKKRLESRIENWKLIFEYLHSENIAGVLVKMTRTTYHLMVEPSYSEAVVKLFSLFHRTPHIIFVHESLFTGVSDKADSSDADDGEYYWDPSYFEPPEQSVRDHVNKLMEQYDLNVVPYRKKKSPLGSGLHS